MKTNKGLLEVTNIYWNDMDEKNPKSSNSEDIEKFMLKVWKECIKADKKRVIPVAGIVYPE